MAKDGEVSCLWGWDGRSKGGCMFSVKMGEFAKFRRLVVGHNNKDLIPYVNFSSLPFLIFFQSRGLPFIVVKLLFNSMFLRVNL